MLTVHWLWIVQIKRATKTRYGFWWRVCGRGYLRALRSIRLKFYTDWTETVQCRPPAIAPAHR